MRPRTNQAPLVGLVIAGAALESGACKQPPRPAEMKHPRGCTQDAPVPPLSITFQSDQRDLREALCCRKRIIRSLMPLHRTGAACLCRGSGAQPGASVLSVQFCCKPAVMTHERTARAEVNKTLSASCAGKQADAAVHGHGGHLLSRRLPWTAAQFRGIAHFLRVCGQRRRRRQASENDCTHPRG